MKPKTFQIITYSIIFIIFFLSSFFVFKTFFPVQKGIISPSGTVKQDQEKVTGDIMFEGPKTEVCPLNGALYTQEERETWETKRPLTVMIENHVDSRPQSGLQHADIVYEAVAEGGITRFMGVFYCGAARLMKVDNKYDIGPVRSARSYFVELASEYADYPLYTHVGGANCSAPKDPVTGRQAGPCTSHKDTQALEQIAKYGWNNQGTWSDLSQFSLSYKACRREPERIGENTAMEHTMYCSSKELWNVAEQRGLGAITEAKKTAWDKNFRAWKYKAEDTSSSQLSNTISFSFWSGYPSYGVGWHYDHNKNLYFRQTGGVDHIDFNTKEQLSTKNIILQFVKEQRSVDQHLHNIYTVIGSGQGVLLQNGEKIDITWSKLNRTSRTIFTTKDGKEVNFVPGQIWIEILPLNTKINYEN
jgi:hypothetical protein